MKANHLFVCLPLVSVLSTVAVVTAAERGDYGDAPDNGPTHYRMMFETSAATGRFPTLYATANSRFVGNRGVHHLVTNQEWFGPMDSPPSRETDANDTTSDDDVYQNLINNDLRDNGLPKIPFFIALTQMPPPAVLSYYVSVPAGAPDRYRYVNVLIDWDQDGQWKQSLVPGAQPEWIIQNHVIDLAPGNTALFTSPVFLWGWNALLGPQCFWMRMTISQVSLDPLSYQDGWDGSGSFPTGETEDYLFHPVSPAMSSDRGFRRVTHRSRIVRGTGRKTGWHRAAPARKCRRHCPRLGASGRFHHWPPIWSSNRRTRRCPTAPRRWRMW